MVVSGCSSKFRKIQKNEDWRVKFEAALTYYEKKDYYRAALLFEDIRPIVRGLPEGEEVEFYLAYCQYTKKPICLLPSHSSPFLKSMDVAHELKKRIICMRILYTRVLLLQILTSAAV